jgi:transcription antitermination factor NusB
MNQSLQKKSASRVAAVQCLYQQAVNAEETPVTAQVARLKEKLAHNQNEQKLLVGVALEPNYTLLEQLLSGVGQWQHDIDRQIDEHLSKGWTRERMSPLLVAILQCSIFEMLYFRDTNPRIVIDEYARITRSFFADSEVDFVHGLLGALAPISQKGGGTHG